MNNPGNRDSAGRFQKGKSGNPSGRKKVPEDIKKAFKAHSMDALTVLVSIINDATAKDADKIRAAEVILDRAYGKPQQSVEVEQTNIPQVVFVNADNIPE